MHVAVEGRQPASIHVPVWMMSSRNAADAQDSWLVTVSINVSVYRGNGPNKKAHHMVWQILGTGPEMTNVLSQ